MSNISLVKAGGVCAILTSVIGLSFFVVIFGALGFSPSDDLGQILPQVNADRTAYLIYNWLQVISAPLGMIAVLGMYQALRRWGDLLWIAVLGLVTGIILFMLANIIGIAIAYELAPRYAEASEATRPALEAMASTLHQAWASLTLIGHVFLWGIGVALFALAILRTSVAPRWVGWLGLFVAVFGGWFGILGAVSVVFELVSAIAFIPFVVWLGAMGVVLLRLPEPVEPATGA